MKTADQKAFTTMTSAGVSMLATININKSVPNDRWVEFFDQFSDGNRGRHVSIEVMDVEVGDEELIKNAPLMAMVYDPPRKGDKLTIEIGKDEVTYAHTIDTPNEVLTGQDENGVVLAVQIADVTGMKTLIQLQLDSAKCS
jgi:Family of unknown function (DUF5335)